MFVVDSREKGKIFNLLEKLKIEYKKATLPIGDYFEDEKNIVIERKTIEDFLGSYVSGHLSEQLTNADNNFDEFYLFISGKFENMFFTPLPPQLKHLTNDSFHKMKLHLLLSFPKLKIVEFPNDSQLLKGVVELFTYEGSKRTTNIVRMKASKEDVFLSQICSVPGIGIEKAKRILAMVKHPYRLYEMDETTLKNIEGIGEVYAKRLKEYFTPIYL